MPGSLIPVLWLCGPAGVGKSTVSWQLFSELAQSGVRIAFADTDQLGMCYPAPAADPGRQELKARNLGAMIGNYREAGARCLIVNGVVDPVLGVHPDLRPRAALTVCRLRAGRDEVARRVIARDGQRDGMEELLQEVRGEADRMDASNFADVCVDTSGVPAAEVAGLVRDSCRDWPGFAETAGRPSAAAAGPATRAGHEITTGRDADGAGRILLICGAAGVGKSTIGFRLYLKYVQAGRTAGYVDLDQIGFASPAADGDPGHHRLKARNLAAIWRNYRAAGATHLIATGPVQNETVLQAYVDALPAAIVTLCRLHAGRAELTRRIMSRGGGGSWPQPGDPLRGQPAGYLARVAGQAVTAAEALERAAVGAVRIDTDGRTVAEAADLIAAATLPTIFQV